MNNIGYQKILFRTAVCAMACDGEIHESEVREIQLAFEQTDFFKDLVFNDEMELVIGDFKNKEKQVLRDYFDQISSEKLNPVQDLQILEIILRIIYADEHIDENEIKFLRIVKSCLDVPDQIFYKRFGMISFLTGMGSLDKKTHTTSNFLENMVLPDIKEMSEMLDTVEVEDRSWYGLRQIAKYKNLFTLKVY